MKKHLAKKIIKSVILFPAVMLMGAGMGGCVAPEGTPPAAPNEPVAPPPPPTSQIHANALEAQLAMPVSGEQVAIMRTNHGDIYIRFFPEYAPLASSNFKGLAEEGFYDGSIFHRIINGFMLQGGDPLGNPPGTGGRSIFEGGGAFEDEFTDNRFHIRGALSMANRGPNTNTSQFFIVQNNNLASGFANPFRMALLPGGENVALPNGVVVSQRYTREFLEHYIQYGGTPHLDFGHTVFGQVFRGMDVVDAIAAVAVDGRDRPVEDVVLERVDIVIWE